MTISLFILTSLLLLLVVMVLVFLPWLNIQWTRGENSQEITVTPIEATLPLGVAIFKARLLELEADFKHQVLAKEDYDSQKTELERQLLAVHQMETAQSHQPSKKLMLILSLWLVVMVVALYLILPTRSENYKYWQAVDTYHTLVDDFLTQKRSQFPESTNNKGLQLIQAMQHNVYAHPTDIQRWSVLGDVFMNVGAAEQGITIAKRLYNLQPANEQAAVAYAQKLIDVQQESIDPDVNHILQQVLQKNPNSEAALMMLSMASFKAADYTTALHVLEQLKAVHSTGSSATQESSAMLDKTIALTKEKLNAKLLVKQNVATLVANIQVRVGLPIAMQGQVKSTDTLFVLIKAAQGAPMPFAVQKLTVSQLQQTNPLLITLSASQEMMPGRSVAQAINKGTPLVVMARISRTGQPTAIDGDLESLPVPIQVSQKQPYDLVIDQVH